MQIQTSEEIKGVEKKLVYLHINGDMYIEMWDMLSRTIKSDINSSLEVLIITSDEWIDKIKKVNEKNNITVHYYVTEYKKVGEAYKEKYKDFKMEKYSGKLDIIDWDKLNEYNKVIYFDTDILVSKGGLKDAFNLISEKDMIYGCKENHHFTQPWFYHKEIYSEEETRKILKGNKNINGINTGVWGWINYPDCKVQKQLKQIRENVEDKSNRIITDGAEQPYINHRWLVDGNFEYKMSNVVTLFPEYERDSSKKIMHFIGENKIARMKRYFEFFKLG